MTHHLCSQFAKARLGWRAWGVLGRHLRFPAIWVGQFNCEPRHTLYSIEGSNPSFREHVQAVQAFSKMWTGFASWKNHECVWCILAIKEMWKRQKHLLGDLRAEQLDAEQRQDLGTVAQLFRERGNPAITGSRKVKSQSGMLSKVGTTSWPALQVL